MARMELEFDTQLDDLARNEIQEVFGDEWYSKDINDLPLETKVRLIIKWIQRNGG